jgi:MoaA/NifB/PqqE/SkfB family radical SAM enzyme
MNKDSSTFCALSHTCLALQNYADFCSCNVNRLSWKNNKHQVLNVSEHPIRDSFKSYTRKMLTAALDNDQRHPSCQACWDNEDAGIPSARQTYNHRLKDIQPEPDQPKILIFKPGNTCNFACRMCNPATSTSWYSDAYKLSNSDVSFKEYTRKFEVIRDSYQPSNTELWDDLKGWMPKLEVIDIYGGEPFLIAGLFDMLEHGVKTDSAKNISIRINTNASIWNQKYIDILKHYKSVYFRVSADSHIPEQFEYIRHKSDFDSVIKNIIRFKDEFRELANFEINCVLTVTSLNVFYVDEIEQHLTNALGMSVGLNFVTGPDEYYDIRHLPIPVKKHLLNKIKNQEIKSFLTQTIPKCDIEWPKFCINTDRVDQLRNQSFQETFPEWWQMLKPFWVYAND